LRATPELVAAYAKGKIAEKQGILALTDLITSTFRKGDHRFDHPKMAIPASEYVVTVNDVIKIDLGPAPENMSFAEEKKRGTTY